MKITFIEKIFYRFEMENRFSYLLKTLLLNSFLTHLNPRSIGSIIKSPFGMNKRSFSLYIYSEALFTFLKGKSKQNVKN